MAQLGILVPVEVGFRQMTAEQLWAVKLYLRPPFSLSLAEWSQARGGLDLSGSRLECPEACTDRQRIGAFRPMHLCSCRLINFPFPVISSLTLPSYEG
jgi:hypothetical protein